MASALRVHPGEKVQLSTFILHQLIGAKLHLSIIGLTHYNELLVSMRFLYKLILAKFKVFLTAAGVCNKVVTV